MKNKYEWLLITVCCLCVHSSVVAMGKKGNCIAFGTTYRKSESQKNLNSRIVETQGKRSKGSRSRSLSIQGIKSEKGSFIKSLGNNKNEVPCSKSIDLIVKQLQDQVIFLKKELKKRAVLNLQDDLRQVLLDLRDGVLPSQACSGVRYDVWSSQVYSDVRRDAQKVTTNPVYPYVTIF